MSERITPPAVSSVFSVRNKVVIVTGAGTGLGRGVARRFAQAGARVVVHYNKNQGGAEQLVSSIQAEQGIAVALGADLTQPDSVTRFFADAVAAFNTLDVLINNAGIYPLHSILDMSLADWNSVVDANLTAAFLCTQAFARQVQTQSESSGGYSIINITSIEAENPAQMHAHYNAAKGGMLMLTRSTAAELAPYNIRVNAVAPGLIWSETLEGNWPAGVERWQRTAPLKRLGMPEDVADACLFFASSASRWVTGSSLLVDGGVMTHQIY